MLQAAAILECMADIIRGCINRIWGAISTTHTDIVTRTIVTRHTDTGIPPPPLVHPNLLIQVTGIGQEEKKKRAVERN